MIQIELPALKAQPQPNDTTLNMRPFCYALRTPAGIWKYLNGSGEVEGSRTVPYAESMVAEALYRHFTAPSRAGRILGLPDGSLFTSLGAGKWTLHNPSVGSTIAHLADFEAEYLTNIANSLGEGVLLANAVELEQRLRQVQQMLAERNAQLTEANHAHANVLEQWRQSLLAVPEGSTAEDLLAETEMVVSGFKRYVLKEKFKEPHVPLLIMARKGSRAYVRAEEDSEAIVDRLVEQLNSCSEAMQSADKRNKALREEAAYYEGEYQLIKSGIVPARILWAVVGASSLAVAWALWGAW